MGIREQSELFQPLVLIFPTAFNFILTHSDLRKGFLPFFGISG